MNAGRFDLDIDAGETLRRRFIWRVGGQPYPITSARVRFSELTTDVVPLLDLSADPEVVVDPDAGTIDLLLSPAQTRALDAALETNHGWWELEATIPSFADSVRLLFGRTNLTPEVVAP